MQKNLLHCLTSKKEGTVTVHMHKTMEIQKSPGKLNAAAIAADSYPSLTSTKPCQLINIESEEEVKKSLLKQDCTVGDATVHGWNYFSFARTTCFVTVQVFNTTNLNI